VLDFFEINLIIIFLEETNDIGLGMLLDIGLIVAALRIVDVHLGLNLTH
jgi:hypothetical protein